MQQNSNAKLTHSERGRLAKNQSEAGKLGGKISRGGGRPKKYATDDERRAAAVRRQTEYRKRIKNPSA